MFDECVFLLFFSSFSLRFNDIYFCWWCGYRLHYGSRTNLVAKVQLDSEWVDLVLALQKKHVEPFKTTHLNIKLMFCLENSEKWGIYIPIIPLLVPCIVLGLGRLGTCTLGIADWKPSYTRWDLAPDFPGLCSFVNVLVFVWRETLSLQWCKVYIKPILTLSYLGP